ncbi:hypothetical protein NHJ6243_001216 [Beauveria neobassiana]
MAQTTSNVTFITGAASGIGAECATKLAAKGGAALCLADKDKLRLEVFGAALLESYGNIDTQVLILVVDVTSESDVVTAIAESVARFGRIDNAIHAAGVGDVQKPTHQVSMEEWTRIIDVNQKGTWLCQREVLRQMMKQG